MKDLNKMNKKQLRAYGEFIRGVVGAMSVVIETASETIPSVYMSEMNASCEAMSKLLDSLTEDFEKEFERLQK
jgi:hypothetical protein